MECVNLYPVLSPTLWNRVSQRFYPVAVGYMRRLGVAAKKQIPCSRIDDFFTITTCGPSADVSAEPAVKFVRERDLEKADVYRPLFGDRCPSCDAVLTNDPRAGQVVCTQCGESSNFLFGIGCARAEVSATNTGYEAEETAQAKRVTTYMYKRTNHFLDHLKRVQAKETTSVRPEVIEAVKSELAKERIPMGDPRITTTKIRGVLKKLRLQKFYNHVFAITAHLSGKAAPSLTPAQEEKLLSLFQLIQAPFEKHCPPDRTNMLSYQFLLKKLVSIAGWHEIAEYFPLLKSRQKVYAQDQLWKKICEDVGLPFQKSIA
jgi:uncharacterized Zn finger protein (UPF0148 family)